MFLCSHKGMSGGGWHFGDWPELLPRGMAGPVGGQLRPPSGLHGCSLIRLTSRRGAAALPAPPAPGLPTGTRPGGVGRRGPVGGGQALTTGPFAVQSDTLGRCPLQRADSACPELLYPQGRGKGGPLRAGQLPAVGWACFPGPCHEQAPHQRLELAMRSWENCLPSLNIPAVTAYLQSTQNSGTQARSYMMLTIKMMTQALRETMPQSQNT